MVVNSCFEDLEGRVGLKRVWEFVPKAGKKRGMKDWLAWQAIADWLYQHRVPGDAQNVKRYLNLTNEHFSFLAVGLLLKSIKQVKL